MYFAIIGNDARMDYVACKLYSLGCEVGRDLNKHYSKSILILPPPVNVDYVDYLLPYLSNITHIYGGSISKEFIDMMPTDIEIIDYLTFSQVVYENAILTAKGIIKEAISRLGNLKDLNIIVTGYGYCGKAISLELQKYCNNITVAVRNHKLKNEIEELGYKYLDINMLSNGYNEYDCLFNTVPANIINKTVIDHLSNSIMIYDIASKPGGVDFDYCNKLGIFARLSLGIPGKEFPKEAGYIISEACYNHYINHYK